MKTKITLLIFITSFLWGTNLMQADNLDEEYCIPTYSTGCQYNMVDDFNLIGENDTSIEDLETGCSTDSYDDRTNLSVDLAPGGNYSAHLTTNAYGDQGAIWIDFGNGFEKLGTTDGMIDQDNGSEIEFTIPTSAEEGEYRMRVMVAWGGDAENYTPCNDDGNKRASGETHDYTVNIISASDCTPPSNFIVKHTYTTEVELEWTANGDENQWKIIYGEAGFSPNEDSLSLIIDDNPEGIIDNLEPNTSYSAYVRAICEEGESSFSNLISFTTLCLPTDVPFLEDFENVTPPALPECGVLENISGSNWGTALVEENGFDSNVLRYVFMMGESANTWFFTQGINLQANKTYSISYKYGNDSFDYFERLKVSYGTLPESEAMTMELADHTSVSSGFPYTNELSFTPPEDGVYYFGFNAYSDSGQSMLYVDDIEIDVEEGCYAPGQIEVNNITDTSAEVSWTPSGEETEWMLTYYEEGNEQNAETIQVSDTPEIILSDLTPETTYEIYISTICEEEESVASETVSFETDEDMSVDDNVYGEFKFYPNPVMNQINVSSENPIEDIRIFDLQGRLVKEIQPNTNQIEISVENLSSGLYFMKVTIQNQHKTYKIIKE